MDRINALSTGEKLIVGAGILILIASFLPWYEIDFGLEGIGDLSVSRNGWESPGAIWSILATLIGVAMAGSIVAMRFGNVALPDLGGSMTWGMLYLGGGVVAVLCILIKLLDESSYLAFGFYLGIIAAIALAAGGYMLYSAEKAGAMRP
jgi:hypothetical protein